MTLAKGQRVRVYYNLHFKCLSIMDKKTRRVVAYSDEIHLENVRFIVSQPGLERIRREKRKSVIAFVEGDYIEAYGIEIKIDSMWKQAYFNPYKVDQFVIGAQPIHKADQVFISNKNIYVKENQCAIS